MGQAQAQAVAPLVARAEPAVLLSSDLARATATAAPIAARTGLPVRTDPRLREVFLGEWQGLTLAQARERFPREYVPWSAGQDVRRGGGETYTEVGARAVQCLTEVLEEVPDGGVVLAVTHGGTARGVICTLLGLPPAHWWGISALGNTCWSVLVERHAGWRLERHGVGGDTLFDPGAPPAPAPDAEPVR